MDNIKEWTSLLMLLQLTMASCSKDVGKEFLLNRLSCPPDDQIGQESELDWTESPKSLFMIRTHHYHGKGFRGKK